jgi:hypothetical protein
VATDAEIALTACNPRISASTVAKLQPAISIPVRRTLKGWRNASPAALKQTLNRA